VADNENRDPCLSLAARKISRRWRRGHGSSASVCVEVAHHRSMKITPVATRIEERAFWTRQILLAKSRSQRSRSRAGYCLHQTKRRLQQLIPSACANAAANIMRIGKTGILEVALNEIFIEVDGHRPQYRSAECEEWPRHCGRLVSSARHNRTVVGRAEPANSHQGDIEMLVPIRLKAGPGRGGPIPRVPTGHDGRGDLVPGCGSQRILSIVALIAA
jgi:hypothetical protein